VKRRRATFHLAVLVLGAVCVAGATAGQQAATAGPSYKKVGQWGKDGTANGQFARAAGLAVDPSGNVYVADADNNRIQVFSAGGKFLRKWGTIGGGDGQFQGADDVAIAPDGTVWVADYNGSRVQQFKADGTFLTSIDVYAFKEGASGVSVGANGDVLVSVIGETYGGVRRFAKTPTGWENKGLMDSGAYRSEDSEVAPDGTIYQLADQPAGAEPHIRHYTADGKAIGSFAPAGGGGFGFGVDLDCNVWVLDAPNRQNVKYSPAGKKLATAVSPDLVTIDTAMGPHGDLYVLQNSPYSFIHFAEDREKPGAANVPLRISVARGKATIRYTGAGFACPAQVDAVATLKGPGVSGRAAVKVAAGRVTPISMAVKGPRGRTVQATFSIVLQTNGRPTTERKSVQVIIGR
jgi:hypothetical protein